MKNKYAYKVAYIDIENVMLKFHNKWFCSFEAAFSLTEKHKDVSLAIFRYPRIKPGKITPDTILNEPKPISVSMLFDDILRRGGIWIDDDTGLIKFDPEIIKEECAKYFIMPGNKPDITLITKEEFETSMNLN